MSEVFIPFNVNGRLGNTVVPATALSGLRGPCVLELHTVDGDGSINNIYLYHGSIDKATTDADRNSATPTYIAASQIQQPCVRRFSQPPAPLTIAAEGVRFGYLKVTQVGEVPPSRYEGAVQQASTPMALHHGHQPIDR